jgi:SAM-dependent methyltransferase
VELGCGVAYFSAWLARRGARPVGVDPTPAQLETARRCMRETGIEFPLVEAYAEDVPLPDEAFDLVLSEYGASIWADPYRWIPEAARLLRDDGLLVFLRNSTLSILCGPDVGVVGEQLVRPQFGMHRFDWREDNGGIEFHLAHGDWVRLLRTNGFELLDLIELQAPPDAVTHEHYDYVPAEWAKQWPSEEIWVARKTRR